jgi:hypothetical protein
VRSLPGNPSRNQCGNPNDRGENVPGLHLEKLWASLRREADRDESDANAGEDRRGRENPAPYLDHVCLQHASR